MWYGILESDIFNSEKEEAKLCGGDWVGDKKKKRERKLEERERERERERDVWPDWYR